MELDLTKAKMLAIVMQIPIHNRTATYLSYKLNVSYAKAWHALQHLEWDGVINRVKSGKGKIVTSVDEQAKEDALIWLKENEK